MPGYNGPCKARQYSDEMHCGRCGLVWDVNDPEPPTCATDQQLKESGRLPGAYKQKKREGRRYGRR